MNILGQFAADVIVQTQMMTYMREIGIFGIHFPGYMNCFRK